MKHIILSMFSVAYLILWSPVKSNAGIKYMAGKDTMVLFSDSAKISPEAYALIERLNEIEAMDKSKLSRTERKQLKTEVKTIKAQLKQISGGVYLSAGALIIVIILLILIL
jgi:hypothetical protein